MLAAHAAKWVDGSHLCVQAADSSPALVSAEARQITGLTSSPWKKSCVGSPEETVAAAAETVAGESPTFWRTEVVLGGGLNNMLMNVAQLLRLSCKPGNVLVMPRLDADPLRLLKKWDKLSTATNGGEPTNGTLSAAGLPPLRFDLVFDWPRFQGQIRPCAVALGAPSGATVQYTEPAELNNMGWSSGAVTSMLERIYAAVQPSPLVQELIQALKLAAEQHAGPRWSAVHLPIEADWWFFSGWCASRSNEDHTRRCFTPAEVASRTRSTRRSLHSTGAVVAFAFDKVHWRGPSLCLETFGEATAKLALEATVPYTFRNAAELFLAVEAPGGFFGNSYSTQSKAIALLRALHRDTRLHNASWAYDCARADSVRWFPPLLARGIVATHPGFARLQSLPGICDGPGALPTRIEPASQGVQCWSPRRMCTSAE